MQAPQQQNVTVYGDNHGPPGAVVIQAVAPTTYVPQQPRTRPAVLPFGKTHMAFGVIQMVVGVFCFLLDVVAISVSIGSLRFGPGIYTGIIFFVAGLLGFLAGRNNSTCCIVGCMVLNIIGSCVAIIGLSFASIEITIYDYDFRGADYVNYPRGTSIFVLCACIFEFIFTIVHSGLTCASCCFCCMPRSIVAVSGGVATTTVHSTNQQVHNPVQQAYFPQQQAYNTGQQTYYPPHMQPQQQASNPGQQAYYPQQMQPGYAYPNQPVHPPYNPAFGPASPELPPPYSEIGGHKETDRV